MIDKESHTWRYVKTFLENKRLEAIDDLISKDDDKKRGRINMIDEILELGLSSWDNEEIKDIKY